MKKQKGKNGWLVFWEPPYMDLQDARLPRFVCTLPAIYGYNSVTTVMKAIYSMQFPETLEAKVADGLNPRWPKLAIRISRRYHKIEVGFDRLLYARQAQDVYVLKTDAGEDLYFRWKPWYEEGNPLSINTPPHVLRAGKTFESLEDTF